MLRLISFLFASIVIAVPAWAAARVVTSIVPIHSIVSAVMEGVGKPELLLPGRLSEHTASFTAAQISDLGKADLVFIVGQGLERKLVELSGGETVGGKTFVELNRAPGIKRLAVREGGGWEAHHHEEEETSEADHAEETLAFDPHIWLDPENGTAMAREAARNLSAADPANASLYIANAEAFARKLAQVTRKIAADLAPVRNRPFIVFHDAYQYFESRFELSAVGSIANVSAAPPSAQRLKKIRGRLKSTSAVCVFREPQFDSKFADTVIEGSGAKSGVLDPLGADLEPGPEAYPKLLRNLADRLKSCLAG